MYFFDIVFCVDWVALALGDSMRKERWKYEIELVRLQKLNCTSNKTGTSEVKVLSCWKPRGKLEGLTISWCPQRCPQHAILPSSCACTEFVGLPRPPRVTVSVQTLDLLV